MKISFASSVMGCEKLKAGTEALLEEMKQIPEDLEVRVEFNENPQLTAKRVGNQVQITCKESAHYYRGLNQVLHHLDTNTYENQETVYFERNGFMLDCSRNAVFTVEKVKSVIRTLAKMGMNVLMLYTEDTYEVPADADCSSWEKPEKGLCLVYWDYYHDDEKSYEKMLNIHKQLSDDVIFAGGSWIWNGIAPNYSKTFACTKAALQTCKKYLMKEVLCTAWMDNGAETPVDAVWPGVALFAHLGFHLEYNEKVLEEEFKECVGGNLKDFMALDAFDSLFLNGKAN